MAKILVVDDRIMNRQFLIMLLAHGKHDLFEAADGAEALKLARDKHPDLIISDILMPTMDGCEFVQAMRSDAEIAHTKVIFYTATYRAREARIIANACGVLTVLLRPSDPRILLDAINKELSDLAQPFEAALPTFTG